MVRKGQKIHYPKGRSSPIRHSVSGHARGGHSVKSYERGSGSRSPQRSLPHKVVGSGKAEAEEGEMGYVVNFKYSNKPGDGESVLVVVDPNLNAQEAYESAMDEAFEERVDSRFPAEIELVDPNIGAMLSWVGDRTRSAIKYGAPKIKKAARLGAKYAVKATMVTAKTAGKVAKAGVGASKELLRLTAFAAQRKIIESLLKACYQSDRAKRTAARVALKKRFPEIYDLCDFSREKRIRHRKRAPKVMQFPQRYIVVK